MPKSLRYRLIHRARKLLGLRGDDDFDWAVYDHKYQQELVELEREYTLCLEPGDATFADGALALRAGLPKPLHPNHQLLYSLVLRLAPSSVLEFGCGGGDHLHNLGVLLPGAALHGLDRAPGQLGVLARRHPELVACTRQADVTKPLPADVPQVDVAYTQAVIMHIQTGELHRDALRNLVGRARDAVVLVENWRRHPFVADLRGLHAAGELPWDELHLHHGHDPASGAPHGLVAAPQPVAGLPRLEDDAVLVAGVG